MRDCSENNNISNEKLSNNANFKHYLRPKEYPFLESELQSTTIIFGGLTWKHEVLLKASFENLGYICDILPNPELNDLQTGKEFCDPGLCNPIYFTFGALLRYLKNLEKNGIPKEKIVSKYVYLTAGSCGPCRYGMYEAQFRIGLANAGYEGFRVIVFQQNEGLDQEKKGNALKFNHDFFLRILGSFILADIVNDVAYQYRPYEVKPFSVDNALKESLDKAYLNLKIQEYPLIIKKISELSEKKIIPNFIALIVKIIYFYFCKEYNEIPEDFLKRLQKIDFNFLKVKPIVKITGEFWAQTTESDGNMNIHKYLEQNGAQVIPEPLSNWILYILHQFKYSNYLNIKYNFISSKVFFSNFNKFFKNLKNIVSAIILEKIFIIFYNHFRKKIKNIPYPLPSQNLLRKLSMSYFYPLIEGGEGHLEIGKALYYSNLNKCHMVLSLKPFGCMPSTMSDGIMSSVINKHKSLLFSSIETGGEGIINMYSRVLMTLNEAKNKAENEFTSLLNEIKLDRNSLKEHTDKKFFIIKKTKISKYTLVSSFFMINKFKLR